MKPRLTPFEPTEAEIQHAAYFLWQAAGRPAGRDLDLWLAAREQLKHRLPARARVAHPQRVVANHRADAVAPLPSIH